MSQIASAYAVTSEELEKLASLASVNDYDEVWNRLNAGASELSEFTSYSGYVIIVASMLLAERDIKLPRNVSTQAGSILTDSELTLLVLADPQEAAEASAAIKSAVLTDEELQNYFEAFTDDAWDEAAQAMRAGIDYLRDALTQAAHKGAWCLVSVG